MKRNANILVAHDFSEGSKNALDYGVEFAIENRAELHFLHVEVLHDDSNVPVEPKKTKAQLLREELRADILKSIEKQGYEYSDLAAIKYAVLREVAAAPAIVEYCKNYNIDVVVMGTHGRRGLKRKILGSVAEEVVRQAPCTVFTIREELKFESLADSMTKIAVPFDFSEHAHQALAYAKEMAASFMSKLDIIHVIEEKLHPAFYSATVASIYDLEPDINERIISEMENVYTELGGSDVEAEFHVLYGHPVKEIVTHVEENKHDLIIISSHGLSGIERAVLGSVTERVVRQAPCPVMTLKAKKVGEATESSYAETLS